MWHWFLAALLLLTAIGAVVNFVKALGADEGMYSASLILAMMVAIIPIYFFERVFALKAQDRAILVQENLRHYIMFGKELDPRLTIRQIIGLRFASDGEWNALIERAIAEGMSEKEIKQAIKTWKPDLHRV